MKKFFKGLAKYLSVIFGVIVCVAGVKVANFFMTRQPEVEQEQSESYGQEEENALTKIVNKIMETENGNIEANFVIETESSGEIQINSCISFKTSQTEEGIVEAGAFDLNGLKLSAKGEAIFDGSLINFDITYLNNYVYADIAGIKVKLATDNFLEDVSSIMNLGIFDKFGMNISLPEISLDSFDTSLLMELSRSIQEEEYEDGKKVSLDLFGMGEVQILTDAEYAIKSIKIKEINVKGVKVKADIGTELNTTILPIKVPDNAEELVDISKFNSVFVAFDKLLNKDYISGQFNFEAYGEVVCVDYAVDFGDKSNIRAYLSTMILSKEFCAVYNENKLFVSYDECKYYFDVEAMELNSFDIDEIVSKLKYIAEKFSIELPTIELPEINNVETSSLFGLSSFVDNLNIDENGISFEINGTTAIISIENEEFARISVESAGFDFEISLNEQLSIPEINEEEFVDIAKLEALFDGIMNQISERKLATRLKVNYEDFEIEADVFVDLTSGFKAKVVTTVEDYDIELIFIDKVVYVEINGLKLKYDLAEKFDIDEFVSLGLEMIQEKVGQVDIDTDKIVEIKNAIDFKLIKVSQNKLVMSINDALVDIGLSEISLKNLAFVYQNIAVNAEILSNDFEIAENGEYFKVNGVEDFVPAILNFIEEKRFSFSTVINVEGFEVEIVGKVDLRNDILAELLISTYDQPLKINIVNDDIYLQLNNLKIKGKIGELIDVVQEFVGEVELPSLDASDLDLFDEFEVSSTQLKLALKLGLSLVLTKDNSSLKNIAVSYDGLDISLNIEGLSEDIHYTESGEYQNLLDFVKLGKLAYDYVLNATQLSEKQFASEITLNIDGFELKAKVYVDFETDLKFRLTTRYEDYDIEIIYKDNTVYAQVNALKLKYEIGDADLETIISAVKGFVGQFVQIPEITISEDDIMSLVENLDFKILSIEENYTKLQFNDLIFALMLGENRIENINLSYSYYSINAKVLSNDFEIAENGEYFKVNGVEDFVPVVVDLLRSGKVAISTSVEFEGVKFDINAKIDFRQGLKAKALITVFEKTIEIDIFDEMVYVQFANFKAKASFEEIIDIINSYTDDIDKFEGTSLDLFDNIEVKENLLSVALKAGLSVDIVKANNKLTKMNVLFDEFDLEININEFAEELVFDLDGEFESIVDYYEFAMEILDFIQNEDLAFELEARYKDYNLSGKVQYIGDKLSLVATTEIIGRQLTIKVYENTIYVDFDGLKLKCDIDKVQDLAEYVADYLGIDLGKHLDSAQELSAYDIINSILLNIVDGKLSVKYEDASVEIDSVSKKITLKYDEAVVKLEKCSQFEVAVSGNYIDLFEIKELSKAVYNTVKNLSISGTIEVTIDLFGEKNPISIDYSVGYIDGKVIGYVETEFKGININAYIDGEDIYLYVVGLQVHFNLEEKDELINWLNDTFDLDLSLDFLDDFKLEDYHLDFVDRVEKTENGMKAFLTNGITIEVEYDEYINRITFVQDNREAVLVCTDFSLVSIENLERDDYRDYSEFTDLIANVYNLVVSKQYKIAANVKRYNDTALTDNINADLVLDVTGALNAYANITGIAEDINVIYENKVLYLCYGGSNGLKVKINESAVQEILSIACSAFNIDTTSIPYLDEFLSKENIDTSNLSSIMPTIELGNPLSYLEYISDFELTDEIFTINLKADKLGIDTTDDEIAVKIYYSNDKITKIIVNKLYINADNKEYINVTINVKDFDRVPQVSNKSKYIDLSSSSDLIKSFVNTSQLNDYHINGKIKLNISIGIEFSAATVGVDALIKKETTKELVYDEELGEYVEVEKSEIVGQVVLTNYPIISMINNVNTNGGLKRVRTISMYFKGGYVYLYTDDEEKNAGLIKYDEYQRATKVTTQYLLNNLEYYMQYLLGFTDTIQNEINESIKSSREYSGVVHYDDMIKSYSHTGKKHTIVLNLAEIVHNDDIGNLTIVITTKNDASTNNKDYLYRLDVNMEVFEGKLSLQTTESSSTDALFLINIGNAVSMAGLESFIGAYDVTYGLGTDGEYCKEGTGVWKQENKGNVTLKFYDRGALVCSMNGAIASSLTTPTITRDAEDNGDTRQEYEFGGWFYDEEFTMPFTSDSFPRISSSLFAKWNAKDLKRYSTLHFVTNEESRVVDDMTSFAGESLTLPTCANIAEEGETVATLKEFKGWAYQDGSPFTANVYPNDRKTTLYAVWEIKQTVVYNVTIHYNTPSGVQTFVDKASAGSTYSFPTTDYIKATTKYYTSSAYTTQVTDFTVNANVVWYARNEYTITVASAYTTLNGSAYSSKQTLMEGTEITLTNYSNFEENKGTYKIKYTLVGYRVNDGEIISAAKVTVPSQDMKYIAEWSVKEYCTVTFNNTWVQPSGWRTGVLYKITKPSSIPSLGSIEVERNTAINPTDYNIQCTAKYKALGIEASYHFYVLTWNTNSAQTIFSVTPIDGDPDKYDKSPITITQNTTLYPTWNATM